MIDSNNFRSYVVSPSGMVECTSDVGARTALLTELKKVHAPRAILLNRIAKYSAVAAGFIGGIGITGAAFTITLNMDARDKHELGVASIGFLLVGFLCCGFSNCLYYCGCSSDDSGGSIQLNSPV